jgi:hypothetical protein
MLALVTTSALAEPLPVAKPQCGSCPFVYLSSGSYCTPTQGAADALAKPPNGTCPWGGSRAGATACATARG